MPNEHWYSQAVELICQAALEPDLWSPALGTLLPNFRSKHASFFTPNDDGYKVIQSGFSEDEMRIHFSPEAVNCWEYWRPRLPVGTMFTNRHIMSDREWEGSETYNEYIRPSQVYHGAVFQQGSPDFPLHFAICRPDINDPYTDDELAALQFLATNIVCSLRLQHRLRVVEQRTSLLSSVLDAIEEAVIVVTASGKPVHANRRAQILLDRGDVLMYGATELKTHRAALTQNLLDAIRAVSDPRSKGDLHVTLPRKKPLLPLLLEVVSLERLSPDFHGAGHASAIIFIREPDAPICLSRQALADTLHLTRRELDIAVLLAEGLGTEVIAEKTGIAIGTVRFHVKRMFQKTGVQSRAALVSLLHGFGSR